MKMFSIVLIFLWLATAVITFGSQLAYWGSMYGSLNSYRQYRSDLAAAVVVAAMPVIGPVIGFFWTGFYADGFAWNYADWKQMKDRAK